MEKDHDMQRKAKTQIKILFIVRVCLWIIALGATVYWMYVSVKLHMEGIFDVHEYALVLRPVLYPCLLISFVSIGISFALYAHSKKLKQQESGGR